MIESLSEVHPSGQERGSDVAFFVGTNLHVQFAALKSFDLGQRQAQRKSGLINVSSIEFESDEL